MRNSEHMKHAEVQVIKPTYVLSMYTELEILPQLDGPKKLQLTHRKIC
jgi:hypothetical protein